MRKGGSKQKGSSFERAICKDLSLWVTAGAQPDVFWRSAMSGGRATVAHRKGGLVRQAGDICAVEEEGIEFCRQWYCECKHVKYLGLESFFIKQTGDLHKFWKKAVEEAAKYKRDVMLIALQNRWPVLVITKHNHVAHWVTPIITNGFVDVTLFSSMLRRPYHHG